MLVIVGNYHRELQNSLYQLTRVLVTTSFPDVVFVYINKVISWSHLMPQLVDKSNINNIRDFKTEKLCVFSLLICCLSCKEYHQYQLLWRKKSAYVPWWGELHGRLILVCRSGHFLSKGTYPYCVPCSGRSLLQNTKLSHRGKGLSLRDEN